VHRCALDHGAQAEVFGLQSVGVVDDQRVGALVGVTVAGASMSVTMEPDPVALLARRHLLRPTEGPPRDMETVSVVG
jgi:hypothetical protein